MHRHTAREKVMTMAEAVRQSDMHRHTAREKAVNMPEAARQSDKHTSTHGTEKKL